MSSDLPISDPYAAIVDLYDLEHDEYDDDVGFYLSSISAAGDPVLELGCGTGRLLRPIAAAGYRVTGVDRSVAMLAKARTSLKPGLRRRITLHEGSMEDAASAPGGPFGVAIFSLNGLMHLADPAAQLNALKSARLALDARGQLLIDVLNPAWDTLRAFDHGVTHEGTWIRDDGVQIDKLSSRRVSPSMQTIQTRIWYDLVSPDGSVQRITTSFALRYLHRNELELMLKLAGFQAWQVYGSYDLDPHDDVSERLIVAAEVTA